MLFGRYLKWTPKQGLSKWKSFTWQQPSDSIKRTEYILSELPEPAWNAWRYICRREFITKRELFFECGLLCEDVPWTLALLENAVTVSFLPEPFYGYYYRRPNSIMSRRDSKRLIDLNMSIAKLLGQYSGRPIICRQLVQQSFLYINEYCEFEDEDRNKIWLAYQTVLPFYRLSASRLHRVAGKFQNQVLFCGLSLCLFILKHLRRLFK